MEEYTEMLNGLLPKGFKSIKCVNGGEAMGANITLYSCEGRNVTLAEYNNQKSSGKCSFSKVVGEICYCPRDFFGNQCEYNIPLYCGYHWVQPTLSQLFCPRSVAQSDNVEYYDNSRFGLPPCIFVSESRRLQFVLKLTCMSHPMATEGYKTLSQYVNQTTKRLRTFTYFINNSLIGLSRPVTIVNALSILNFNEITDFVQVQLQSDEAAVLTGTKTITFDLDFTYLQRWRYGGRWYFEVLPASNSSFGGTIVFGAVTRSVIDDALYVEPSRSTGIAWWIIFIIVLTVVVVIGLIVLAVVLYIRKQREEAAYHEPP